MPKCHLLHYMSLLTPCRHALSQIAARSLFSRGRCNGDTAVMGWYCSTAVDPISVLYRQMRRREFIILLSGATAWPIAARAQQVKVWRIGMLETIPPDLNAANLTALRQGLQELGYVKRQNYVLEY